MRAKNKADKDLNLKESIKRLNNRISSFERYFGAESEVAQHFKDLAYKQEGIKFKDGKIDSKTSTLEGVQAALKAVPVTRSYVAEIRKELGAKKGATEPTKPKKTTFTKKQVMIEANARVKIANEFEKILEELYMYREADSAAIALSDEPFEDALDLIHHKGEDWSYGDIQSAIDLIREFINSKIRIH